MSAIPPQRQIQLQQIPGAPSWLAGLLVPLNKIIGALYDAINAGITIPANIPWQFQTLTVSLINGEMQQQQFKNTTGGKVKGVVVVGTTGGPAPVGAVVVNTWTAVGDQITIPKNSLTGLGNGTYTITLLVIT